MNIPVVFTFCLLLCLEDNVGAKKKKHKRAQNQMNSLQFSYNEASYQGPRKWVKKFPECGGKRQSPIWLDLKTSSIMKMPKLVWSNYEKTPQKMFMSITNHALVLRPVYASDKTPTLKGGNVNSSYALRNLAFRWSAADGRGSDHEFANGHFLDMEIQLVFTNQQYKTEEEQLSNEDGLAIVAYFAKKYNTGHPVFDKMWGNFGGIDEIDKEVAVAKPFPVSDFGLSFPNSYLTYKGSLTMPPCSEVVMWLFPIRDPLPISNCQLQNFRSLYRVDKGLINNYRPIQPKNGRKIIFAGRD